MSRTTDDEVRLGEAVRAGAEQCRAATEELVRHNQALVLRVAVTADAALPLEDRVQAGNLGLLQAVEKYAPAVGTKFSTYAAWWIRARDRPGRRQRGADDSTSGAHARSGGGAGEGAQRPCRDEPRTPHVHRVGRAATVSR